MNIIDDGILQIPEEIKATRAAPREESEDMQKPYAASVKIGDTLHISQSDIARLKSIKCKNCSRYKKSQMVENDWCRCRPLACEARELQGEGMTQTSEFGKGFAYCLGLFLAHAEQEYAPERWFDAATDHLREFDAENAPYRLQERCVNFRDKCIDFRYSALGGYSPKKEDVCWAIQEAKDILREYDLLNGFDAVKGEWE